jgi:hypothetical protein
MSAWAKKVSIGSVAPPAKAPAKTVAPPSTTTPTPTPTSGSGATDTAIATTPTATTTPATTTTPSTSSSEQKEKKTNESEEEKKWRADPWAAFELGLRAIYSMWDDLTVILYNDTLPMHYINACALVE